MSTLGAYTKRKIRDNHLVFGFVNSVNSLYAACKLIIPKEIIFLCLKYYHIKCIWDKKNTSTFYTIDDYIIRKKETGFKSAFLSIIMDKGIYSFTFKILNIVELTSIDNGPEFAIWITKHSQPNHHLCQEKLQILTQCCANQKKLQKA